MMALPRGADKYAEIDTRPVAVVCWSGAGLEGAGVVRIHPREPQIAPLHLSLGVGALEGLVDIDRRRVAGRAEVGPVSRAGAIV